MEKLSNKSCWYPNDVNVFVTALAHLVGFMQNCWGASYQVRVGPSYSQVIYTAIEMVAASHYM
jgi:hypothetical protein